jgi:hypothetical protein
VVTLSPGRHPFAFAIADGAGGRLELQAENEDDMVKWITAIRRCKQRYKGRGGRRNSANSRLQQLIAANATCCECGDERVTWASFSVGCTLCEYCASVHRQMGMAVSKLRSLELDEWSPSLLDCFVESLGNARVNQVWEASVMKGWSKPVSNSPPEQKSEWIVSKYQWYAFVGEDRGDKDTNSRRLMEAAARGDTAQAMWCIAHKGSPTWRDIQGGMRTPLHATADGGHRNTALYLLVNGGSHALHLQDARHETPYEIARKKGDMPLLQVFLECEKGDYL